MAAHETGGASDEWYTPDWVFSCLKFKFDLDPCNISDSNPAANWAGERFDSCGLNKAWFGSVWLNPPYGGRNGIRPWMECLAKHGNGIAIVPNRTGSDWWQDYAEWADGLLFVRGKIRFVRPDGSEGLSPGYGNVLMSFGRKMTGVLHGSSIRGLRR